MCSELATKEIVGVHHEGILLLQTVHSVWVEGNFAGPVGRAKKSDEQLTASVCLVPSNRPCQNAPLRPPRASLLSLSLVHEEPKRPRLAAKTKSCRSAWSHFSLDHRKITPRVVPCTRPVHASKVPQKSVKRVNSLPAKWPRACTGSSTAGIPFTALALGDRQK